VDGGLCLEPAIMGRKMRQFSRKFFDSRLRKIFGHRYNGNGLHRIGREDLVLSPSTKQFEQSPRSRTSLGSIPQRSETYPLADSHGPA